MDLRRDRHVAAAALVIVCASGEDDGRTQESRGYLLHHDVVDTIFEEGPRCFEISVLTEGDRDMDAR